MYFDALEKIGFQKRGLLKDRIIATQKSQKDTAEDFKTALERFREVVPNAGSKELEGRYSRLSSVVEKLVGRRDQVKTRISRVENVADALFAEWKKELSQYQSDSLRSKSQQQFDDTKVRYSEVRQALEAAYQKIDPALRPLQDQVLFLKHNLNASAISSLEGEKVEIAAEIADLIREIEKASQKSESFIAQL